MFENATIESKRKPKNLSRLLVLPVSIALHGIAIAALTFATVWTVELPAATPTQYAMVFISDPLPPPPPPPLGDNDARPPRTEPDQVSSHELTPPRDTMVPDAVPDEAPETNTAGQREVVGDAAGPGVPWGVPGGDPDGEPGGVIGGVPNVDHEPALPEGPVPVTADMRAPALIHKVEPAYPRLAILSGQEGSVVLECIIDRNGGVRNVQVVASRSDLLSGAAVDAVRQWRFSPATLNGRPLDVIFRLTVVFDLDRVR